MKKIYISKCFGLFIIFLSLLALVCAQRGLFRPSEPLDVDMISFLDEFYENELAASLKYEGKRVRFSATVEEIAVDDEREGQVYVAFRAPLRKDFKNFLAAKYIIRFFLEKSQLDELHEALGAMISEKSVTITGRFTSVGEREKINLEKGSLRLADPDKSLKAESPAKDRETAFSAMTFEESLKAAEKAGEVAITTQKDGKIKISGKIGKIAKAKEDEMDIFLSGRKKRRTGWQPAVIMGGSGFLGMNAARCFFPRSSIPELVKLKRGQDFTVICGSSKQGFIFQNFEECTLP